MTDQKAISVYVSEFLEYLEVERNVSKLTIRNYRHYLNRFVQWLADNSHSSLPVSFTLDTIRKYRLYLSRIQDRDKKPITATTQSYHIIALRSLFKWLARMDVSTVSVEKIEIPKHESRSLKFLNQKQTDRLLGMPLISTEAGLRDKAILELLFSTGLRVSELCKLDRDKIDFSTREFGVIGKGRRARVVFLSKSAARWLKRYFDQREDTWKPAFIRYAREKEAKTDDGEDMRLTARSVQRIVEKYRKRAKLPIEITPHGLRHTFATDLLSHGAGLREVQEMLGHKNVATTQVYTHVTNPQLKKVHEKFHTDSE